MAHALEMVNGQAQMAYAGETPWHGLGVRVSNDLTPEQMLEAAGLDWSVEAVPLFAEVGDQRLETGHSALIRDRDQRVLDVITNDWNPTQNIEAFEFFNDFVAAGDMSMETAGSLKDGNVIWALAKVSESFELFDGRDRVDAYLLFTNPHQYGKSIDVRFTGIRTVCWNTLTLALQTRSKSVVKVSHRRKFDGDVVKETLGITKDKLGKYKEMAEYLSQRRFDSENIVEYFQRVFPVVGAKSGPKKKELSKSAKSALDLHLHAQPGAELGEGTFWQAYNTVTYMIDHVLGRSQDTRLRSAWYGAGSDIKVNALELALEMAK